MTSGSGPRPSYSFNTANNQISGYTYDAAGNQTYDGTHHYTYDAEGNVVQVDSGSTATYIYDTLNHRVETTVSGAKTDFVFNGAGQRVSEWNATSHAELDGQYYWGSQQVAFYTTIANSDPNGPALYFEHRDWEGTERMRTDSNGNQVASFTSLPFGDAQTQTTYNGDDLDANHFAQLDFDTETDTDHAQFRQYSPTEGRWMRPDSYAGSYNLGNPQSMNRYVYAANNPLSNIDPSGQDCIYAENGGYVANAGDCGSTTDAGYYIDCDGCTNGVSISGVVEDPNGVGLLGYAGTSSTTSGLEVLGFYNGANGNLMLGIQAPTTTVTVNADLTGVPPPTSAPNPMLPMNPLQGLNTGSGSLLQKWARVSVLSPHHCRGAAARAFTRDMTIGEGVGAGAGAVIGGLVAGGATAATDTYPLAGATVPAGMAGGAAIGTVEALPLTFAGSLIDAGITYATCD